LKGLITGEVADCLPTCVQVSSERRFVVVDVIDDDIQRAAWRHGRTAVVMATDVYHVTQPWLTVQLSGCQ